MQLAISHQADHKILSMLTSSPCTEMQTALHLIPYILVLFPNSRELFILLLLHPNKCNYMNLQAQQVIEANKPQQG
jgi:hypothetical protein